MNLQFSFKDFIFGMLAGLFFALIAWLYMASCHIHLSLTQGLPGFSIAMLSFGIVAGIFGIEKLLDNINVPL